MITEEQIIENNILIANFLGWEFHGEPFNVWYVNGVELQGEFEFHSSWDWLMKVVEKIENMPLIYPIYYLNVRISQGYVEIEGLKTRIFRNTSVEGDKLTAVYLAIVDFIKVFNTIK